MTERKRDGAQGGFGDFGRGEDSGGGFEQADEADLANGKSSGTFGGGDPAIKGVNIGGAVEHGQHQTFDACVHNRLQISVEIGCCVEGVDADEDALLLTQPVAEQAIDPAPGSGAVGGFDAVFEVENHGIGACACDTVSRRALLGKEQAADGGDRC